MIEKYNHFKLFLLAVVLLICSCGGEEPTRALIPGGTPTALSISGTITAAVNNAVDSDTNDASSPLTVNNTPATAQNLSNPVVLGGYLTRVPTGNAGDRFSATADDQDWYHFSLAAGQTITLTISDHDGNAANTANPDFDIFLYDVNNVVVGNEAGLSWGLGRQEIIPVTVSGEYYLQVWASDLRTVASNYTLSVGTVPLSVQQRALSAADEFVPGEIIVQFQPAAAPAGAVAPLALNDPATDLGLVARAGRPGGPMLFELAASPVPQAQVSVAPEHRTKWANPTRDTKRETIQRVEMLRGRSDVVSADLNYIRRPLFVPSDPLFTSQWNLAQINLPQAWDQTTGAATIVVAVLDTGILFGHPDLAGQLCTVGCQGYDFVSSVASGGDGDGIDPDPTDPGDQSLPGGSSSFHGTHVAGTIGALHDTTGVAGIAPTGKIMPVRVLGIGTSTSYDVMQGVSYAAGLMNDSGTIPANPAHIINLSLGGGGYSQTEQDLFTQVRNAGVIVVAAAGNSSSSLPLYPASYDGVVSVSAVDIDKSFASSYSNYGAFVDVAAPGGNLVTDRNGDGYADGVLSTIGDDHTATLSYTYAPYMGTSMATPHVAGVAALMLAVDPAMTPADFDILLAAGALTEDLGAVGRDDLYGYGLIDAQKAVLAAINLAGGFLPPSLAFTPNLLNFGATSTSLPLTLTNIGGGAPTISPATWSAPWITDVSQAVPTADGLGDYTITVDRTGLTDAVYAATITFTTDTLASYSVPVLLQVGTTGVANAGYHSIYLLDAGTGTLLQSIRMEVDPLSGTYVYSFANVAPGDYLVSAGTDSDNDGMICDPGEACGSYPMLTDPLVISIVNNSRSNVNFNSGFDAAR